MDMHILKSYITIILLAGAIILCIGCSGESGKMPITTTSTDALENFLKGRDLVDRLRLGEGRGFFQKAVKADTSFAMAYLSLAADQSNLKTFFEYYNKALSLLDNVSEGERMIILARQARLNSDPQREGELLRNMVALYPKSERAHNLLGNFMFEQQDFQAAIKEFTMAIEINKDFSSPYNMLGYSLRRMGSYKDAEKAFKKYIELIPDDPNPYDSYAELKMKMGDFGLSIEFYYKALEVDPNFTASHFGIASNFNYLGKHQHARDQLQELFESTDSDGLRRQALMAMAVSYADEGNLAMAFEAIEKRYKMAELLGNKYSMGDDLAIMANILLEMDQVEKAEDIYAQAVGIREEADMPEEIKENNRKFIPYSESRIALKRNDIKTAKTKLEEFRAIVASQNNPAQTRLLHQLSGMVALAENEYDLAISELEQANQQNPYNIFKIAVAIEEKGDIEQARKMYDAAANFNIIGELNYSYIRMKAKQKAGSLGQEISGK